MAIGSNIISKINDGKYVFSLSAIKELLELGLRTQDALDVITNGSSNKAYGDENESLPYYVIFGTTTRQNQKLEIVCSDMVSKMHEYLIVYKINDTRILRLCTSCFKANLTFTPNIPEKNKKPINITVNGKGDIAINDLKTHKCLKCLEEYLDKESIEDLESKINALP
jgi:hypothetical protein